MARSGVLQPQIATIQKILKVVISKTGNFVGGNKTRWTILIGQDKAARPPPEEQDRIPITLSDQRDLMAITSTWRAPPLGFLDMSRASSRPCINNPRVVDVSGSGTT
ncbi:hypothetical protein KP79_PYT18883 [Mizuhopecten yessoensis]|uniref:Uncharacterized protein n=1 Tax=Mizuhopecten yessoensis TaxID=6573 RepID=A0A210QDJ9_MIZYE|nr:hypothetical protein KP79_PYT18883 [Mizuhopecten yessoensis]